MAWRCYNVPSKTVDGAVAWIRYRVLKRVETPPNNSLQPTRASVPLIKVVAFPVACVVSWRGRLNSGVGRLRLCPDSSRQSKINEMHYLNSFKPLCQTKQGRVAIEKFGFPPFIDTSCRREPDFQADIPSISALCRGKMFAPRLREGDSVIYMTVKGQYAPVQFRHWRLVAILRVIKRFESHKDAALWYREKGLSVPSNCMVDGNACLSYEMTAGTQTSRFGDVANTDELLKRWDLSYRLRAKRCGVFLACEAEFLSLYEPPILTDEDLLQIFGRIPPTLTPPAISESEYQAMREIALSS